MKSVFIALLALGFAILSGNAQVRRDDKVSTAWYEASYNIGESERENSDFCEKLLSPCVYFGQIAVPNKEKLKNLKRVVRKEQFICFYVREIAKSRLNKKLSYNPIDLPNFLCCIQADFFDYL